MKEISSVELRELTIEFFKNEETTKPKEIVKLFSNYINAYCAEMKKNEYDILFNDELYEFVYSIFHTLVFKKKVYGIEKNC
jgi:hypothetical protein